MFYINEIFSIGDVIEKRGNDIFFWYRVKNEGIFKKIDLFFKLVEYYRQFQNKYGDGYVINQRLLI